MQISRRNLFIYMSGRQVVPGILRFAVQEEKHGSIGFAPHEINVAAIRIGCANGFELFFKLLVVCGFDVVCRACQRLDFFQIHGFGCQPRTAQQFLTHLTVGTDHQPPGSDRSCQQYENHQPHHHAAVPLTAFFNKTF